MQIDNWHLRCPKCGEDTGLQIEIRAWLTVEHLKEIAQNYLDMREVFAPSSSWNGKSLCECSECGHSATVEDFKE